MALQQSEYKQQDEMRAMAADHLMWLKFETKIRNMVENLLNPVVEMTTEERVTNISLVVKAEDLAGRVEQLEQATFKTNLYKNPTYLMTIDRRLTTLERHTEDEFQKAHYETQNTAEGISKKMENYEV
jgi:hypothetical protein